MHTDPDWRKLWTVLPFCKLCRALHFDCLCSVFVLLILTCVLLLLCGIRLQFENYVDCWPRGVFCFWTQLNCAPVFSTFLLSIGQDRRIVLREQNYMRSRAVGSQRSKLRRNDWICAGWACKRFSGQVRAEWLLFIQTDCTALRRGPHPGGLADAAGQGFGFGFPYFFKPISIRMDTCWVWPRLNVSHMLHILMHTHVRHTSNIRHTNYDVIQHTNTLL